MPSLPPPPPSATTSDTTGASTAVRRTAGRLRLASVALATLLGGALLAATTPATLAAARAPGADGAAMVTAVALGAAWLVVARLLATVTAVCLTALPGALGRSAARAARCASPALLRRTVELSLGVAVAAGPLVGAAAGASAATADPGGVPVLDRVVSHAAPLRPSGHVRPAAPPASRPVVPAPHGAASAASAASAPSRARDDRGGHVVVRPGDSLWRIAARALGPGHSAADVARAWPRWYAANRDAVGPDPGLLRPGQRLVPPAPERAAADR